MDPATCFIDGFGPLPVERPASAAQIGDVVRRAAGEHKAIYPVGGQTMLGLGQPPLRPGWAVDVRGLDQVIDYPARDMTITVQAGITIARLQALLFPEDQRLPIDVPQAARATLGGVLATSTSGPRRYGYGTLRDYVLGISVVNDQGHEAKAGGRVVKNVAGYDLCKLYIGSLGTLGVITQATLKLRPRAAEQALIAVACQGERLGELLDRLHQTATRPVCLDVLNSTAAACVRQRGVKLLDDAPWALVAGFEGNAEAVSWQVQQLIRELGHDHALEARVDAAANPLWQALVEFPAPAEDAARQSSLAFKANLLPSATADVCRQLDALAPRPRLLAHAGNGIVVGHLGPGLTKQRAVELVAKARELGSTGQGRVIVLDCPPSWKDDLNVWGPPGGDAALMRTVKEKLDPQRLFNPGRFVDGI